MQTQHSFSATDESPEANSIGEPQDGQDAEIASLHSSRSQPASRSISFFSEGAGICDYPALNGISKSPHDRIHSADLVKVDKFRPIK